VNVPEAREHAVSQNRWPWRLVKVALMVPCVSLLSGCMEALVAEDNSAICPKCLQHAYIHEVRVFGLPVLRDVKLHQGPGGIMSPTLFSPEIPSVEPKTYEEINGTRCRHSFKRGGMGITCLLSGCHADGMRAEWKLFLPRVAVTEALYVAFRKTGDKETARALYDLIDAAYPTRGLDLRELLWAVRWTWAPDREDREWLKGLESDATCRSSQARLYRRVYALRQMTERLAAVGNADEFRRVLAEFPPRLQGQ